jgi:hypothetical protein
MSPLSLRNNMGTAETKELRLSCSDCNLIFSSQREFQLHVDELHGELGRCLKVGCEYSGSIPADQLEAGKERAENGIYIIIVYHPIFLLTTWNSYFRFEFRKDSSFIGGMPEGKCSC